MGENISNGTLYDRVEEKRGSLSKKELETAEYMAAHQEQLIYSSITDLAERAGSSEATVTRVCGKLGYRGFQALKVGWPENSQLLRRKYMRTLKLIRRQRLS